MKDKLIELLGLKADATDEQIIGEVSTLKSIAASKANVEANEREITQVIQRSGGALNRQGAEMVLKNRKAAAAEAEKSEKKKAKSKE